MGHRTRLTDRLLYFFYIMLKKKKNSPPTQDEEENKHGLIKRIELKIKEAIQFLSYDIWRLNPDNFSNKKNLFYAVLKIIMLTVRGVQEQDLSAGSRSLTYRSVLSIVPMLAVFFAIARGFGFETILESQLFDFFKSKSVEVVAVHPEQHAPYDRITHDFDFAADSLSAVPLPHNHPAEHSAFSVEALVDFVNKSLEQVQGGVFAGIGVLLLLYTVILLFTDIEDSFNRIWGVVEGRTWQRRIIDYFALMLLLPIFVVLNSGLTAILQSSQGFLEQYSDIFTPMMTQVFNILPFLLMTISLTLLYRFMPNTKVTWMSALVGGIVAGIAIQIFQMVYLTGQLWITKYNAVYGTFAAIPLLLLWLQMSWFLVLIGAELAYATQNVRKFSFDREAKNISRRYRDFFTIMVASAIVKRFADSKPPMTADQISMKCKAPIKLTNDIIDELRSLNIISPTPSSNDVKVMAYQPAMDINLLTVNGLIKELDKEGSEDFLIDVDGDFAAYWKATINTRRSVIDGDNDVLLKDL